MRTTTCELLMLMIERRRPVRSSLQSHFQPLSLIENGTDGTIGRVSSSSRETRHSGDEVECQNGRLLPTVYPIGESQPSNMVTKCRGVEMNTQ